MEKLKVAVIGGFGAMASPMSRHWRGQERVQVLRVHDRGQKSPRHQKIREEWKLSQAELVSSLSELYGAGDLDGFFICVGKNGDDLPLLKSLAQLIEKNPGKKIPFICHLSTVSVRFVEEAQRFFSARSVHYVNYPLTGGPLGAENASMLILASGDEKLYERLRPALELLGRPKFFGAGASAGTQVKLMGHMMVFNGLMGICSAAAVHSVQFQQGQIGGAQQGEFFDFLNSGAGGTRQWEVILSQGIKHDVWDRPFLARYGLLDAVYTAQLMIDSGLSEISINAVLAVAMALAKVVLTKGEGLATHAILPDFFGPLAKELDQWMRTFHETDESSQKMKILLAQLSPELAQSLHLEISARDFSL